MELSLRKFARLHVQKFAESIRIATASTKGTTPARGGEEAEVVVYQPRGVELMHTRHKPSLPTIHTSQQASASIEGPGNRAGTGQNSRRNHLS